VTEQALFLADVVGSTRLTHELGEARAAELWRDYNRRTRELIRTWRGREIERSDGFFALFDNASDAVAFASVYRQNSIDLHPSLLSRIGVHWADVNLRSNSPQDIAVGAGALEVDGIAKPVVARIMALASAGQVLVTHSVVRAAALAPPVVRSVGHWQLRGIEEPLELFCLVDGQGDSWTPVEHPKARHVVRRGDIWVPAETPPHNLPAESDAFVGRAEALAELRRLWDEDKRLVCLAGPGGVGKTRLAIRGAWRGLVEFPGGAWFCDLVDARSVDGICFAIATALDVPLTDRDPVEQLAHAIAGRGRCLLVLDNFEQLTAFARSTVGRWLERAAEASFLVTTREVLGLPGEYVLALQSLSRGEARSLFVLRAQAAGASCEVDDGALEAVDQLTEMLDRLPLAIELAAARSRILSPADMLDRVADRFDLLVARQGRSARQSALLATIDWSWSLLSPEEKAALAQLSVFEGGCSLKAAEAVVEVEGTAASTVDLVQALVEKSLVRPIAVRRFELLLSIKQFARTRLSQAGSFEGSGAAAELAVKRRHWLHFAGHSEEDAVESGAADTENFIAACRNAAEGGDILAAVLALVCAWHVLALRGPYAAALDLARVLEEGPKLDPAADARVQWVAGSALFMLGRTDAALQRLEAGLAALGSTEDPLTRTRLLVARGELHVRVGRFDRGTSDFEAALTLLGEAPDPSLECKVLNAMSSLAAERGDLMRAHEFVRRAFSIAESSHDRRWQGGLLGNLAFLDYVGGRLDDAIGHYRQALAVVSGAGDRRWTGNTRCNLGLLLKERGDFDAAKVQLEEALSIARAIGHQRLEGTVLCNLGLVEEGLGNRIGTRNRLIEAVDVARATDDPLNESEFLLHLAAAIAKNGEFDQARRALDRAESVTPASAPALNASLLLARADVELAAGQAAAARAALERATAYTEQLQGHAELQQRAEALRRRFAGAVG
jgi:predicted ATPase/class 3 adenylate cyclase/Tfp pilus assembly protein PilF